jgi:tetratricopeptide (TPR) repeat protein
VRPALADAPLVVPLVGVFSLFAVADAGYAPVVWLPAALFLLALFAVTAAVRADTMLAAPRAAKAAVALLFAFVAWSYLSIVWAGSEADAWDGANRAFLYALVFTLCVVWPWTAAGGELMLAAFSVATALIGAGAFVRTVSAAEPLDSFIGPLLAEPVGYHNANAALPLLAFWPAAILASRAQTPPLLRAVLLACAGVLVELAVLSQSRGSVIAFSAAAALSLAIVPGRLRLVVAYVPIGIAVGLALPTLLDVYRVARDGDPHDALVDARTAIALSALALFFAGLGLSALERVKVSVRAARTAGVALAAIGAAAAAIALAVGIARAPDAWSSFKRPGEPTPAGSRFTGGLGSNRYDFWRVALGEFRDSPVLGIGADNFSIEYLRERRSDEEPSYPHSLEVQVLSQTGVVGGGLLAAFFAVGAAAAFAARRRGPPPEVLVAAACLVLFGYWLVHASGDWFWEFPGLTAPALAFLGLAASLGRGGERAPARRLLAAPAIVVGTAGAASLALPWLTTKEVEAAAASWRSDPQAAYARLERARRLNPLSERPDLVAGAIASRARDWPTMRAAFARALERNPSSWYAEFELAVVDAVEGRRSSALGHLERAHRLNPREPALAVLRDRIRSGSAVDPDAFDRFFLQRVEERTS